MLGIVPSYNPVQHQGKLMMQTWENGKKKPTFKPDFGPLNFFSGVLSLLIARYCSELWSYAM